MAECRICLDTLESGRERLISPCRCSGSQQYIHESCLQRWRDEDLNLATRDRCEICRTDFKITSDHQKETYIIRLYDGSWIPPIICYFISSGLFAISFAQFDTYNDLATIHLITPSYLNQPLISLIQNDQWFDFGYYTGFSGCVIALIYMLSFAAVISYNTKRCCRYWRFFFPYFIFYSALSSSFIPILYCGLLFSQVEMWLSFLLSTTFLPLPVINCMHKSHNNIIMQMNLEDNHEHILSLEVPVISNIVIE